MLILVLLVPCVASQIATYTITAPDTIRRNTNFQVAITNHGPSSGKELKVDVQVTGRGNVGGLRYSSSGVLTVPAQSTKTLTLKIGNWEEGDYRLQCNGTGVTSFTRTTKLKFNNKEFSILIQLDKSIYQREQKIHFRVISFNSNLLPYGNETLTVYINDGDGNMIKRWIVPIPKSGIFENQLQLSDEPVFGKWSLIAQIRNIIVTEKFEVAEYTLPRFSVNVKLPRYITQDDDQFPLTIDALYAYSGKVPGTYLVNVTDKSCTISTRNCHSKPVVLTGSFRGTAQVIVRIKDLQLDSSTVPRSLNILVLITEQLTAITVDKSTNIMMYKNLPRIEIKQPNYFKPQASYTFDVKLLQPNGDPAPTNPSGLVNVTVSYGDGFAPKHFCGEFGSAGTISHTVVPPADAEVLTVVVTYKTVSTSRKAYVAQSISNKFVTISVDNKSPNVGDTLTVKVSTTFKPENPFSYQVVGKGMILIAKTETLTSPSNSFSFKITREMTPHVRIVGYYLTKCGEIVGDALDISVNGVTENEVKLQLSSKTGKPGDNVTISISAKPESVVALMSVDQSVLLRSSGEDITTTKIVNELLGYDIGINYFYPKFDAGIIQRPTYGGSFDPIFAFAGLVLITDGIYFNGVFSRIIEPVGPPGGLVDPNRVKNFFPDVGIWINTITDKNGKAELTFTVPPTLTSWVFTAFVINELTGLGTTNVPTNLTVSRNFYIVVNVPYVVVRTEVVTIRVLVFNNLDKDIPEVIVTLDKTSNPTAYDFIETSLTNKNVLTTKLKIGANDVQVITIKIRPQDVGTVNLNVKAVSPLAVDQVVQPLLIKSDGDPKFSAKTVFVDLRENEFVEQIPVKKREVSEFDTTMEITIPPSAVVKSQSIQCSAIGDIMAPLIDNIKALLRMPIGCGEQNMIIFVPDVVLIKYLDAINQLSPEFNKTAISYLEIGYQRQLTFRRDDGSFSAWGKADAHGSTWLTAFVVKSFVMADEFIIIDPNVIKTAKRYLASMQTADGQFTEAGNIYHKAMKGGAVPGITMTSFVLISFIEKKKRQNNEEFVEVIKKATKYLEDNADAADNSYELAIVCYALHLANSTKRHTVYNKLVTKTIVDGDYNYWSFKTASGGAEASYDIETTGYALLTVNLRPEITYDAMIPIIRWLVSKRNSLGGHESSQDTVIAIQALATVGPKFAAPKNSFVEVTLSYMEKSTVFNLSEANALVFQKVQIPKETRIVNIRAIGNGVGLIQCAWNYNAVVKNSIANPAFNIIPLIRRPNDQSYSLYIKVSALYKDTNMVLVEVDCLTGYELDLASLPKRGYVRQLTRVELSNKNTHVAFYFEYMLTAPKSLTVFIKALKIFDVDDVKDALIKTYDYYEPSKQAVSSYNLPPAIG